MSEEARAIRSDVRRAKDCAIRAEGGRDAPLEIEDGTEYKAARSNFAVERGTSAERCHEGGRHDCGSKSTPTSTGGRGGRAILAEATDAVGAASVGENTGEDVRAGVGAGTSSGTGFGGGAGSGCSGGGGGRRGSLHGARGEASSTCGGAGKGDGDEAGDNAGGAVRSALPDTQPGACGSESANAGAGEAGSGSGGGGEGGRFGSLVGSGRTGGGAGNNTAAPGEVAAAPGANAFTRACASVFASASAITGGGAGNGDGDGDGDGNCDANGDGDGGRGRARFGPRGTEGIVGGGDDGNRSTTGGGEGGFSCRRRCCCCFSCESGLARGFSGDIGEGTDGLSWWSAGRSQGAAGGEELSRTRLAVGTSVSQVRRRA